MSRSKKVSSFRMSAWTLLILIFVSLVHPYVVSAQSCTSCAPARLGIATNLSNVEVCFDTDDFSGTEITNMQAGMQSYWGDYFSNNEIPISISFSSASSCDSNLVEVVRANLTGTANAGGAQATPSSNAHGGAKIEVDLGVTGSADDWKGYGGHELGHILDYDNLAGNCAPYSMMASPFVWNGASMQCGDHHSNVQRWTTSSNETYEPSVYEEDCWDYYWTTITYCHAGGNNWVECGWKSVFLGTDCSPPI